MSFRKFLAAGGLSMILLLASCGGEEEPAEETIQEEDAEADTVEDGMDASADEAENTEESATGAEDDEVTDESTADVQEEADDEGTELSKTFVLEEAGSYNELTYHYVGDEVKRQTSRTEMDYEALGATNEEEARMLLDDIARAYNATEGVQHDIHYGEDAFVETLAVDYGIADISEVSELEGADFEGVDGAQFISMASSEKHLLDSGYILTDGGPIADDAADIENNDGSPRNIDFFVMDEKLSADGSEIPSMFELNSGIGSLLENAEASDADIDDILKPSDEITNYFSETFMVIHVFAGGSEYPADSDFAGLNAEIDESTGFEVYSEFYDTLSGTFLPNIYANEILFLVHDGAQWIDQSGTAASDEVYYGNYSNLYDAFMTTSDLISISEDEDHYFLYNIGGQKALHDVFGSIFNVEYTGADMDAMQNAVVGIIDKSTGEFAHVAYISTAPGLGTDEVLHIEISAEFDDYGEYDDGITIPEVSESRSAGAPASSGMAVS